MKLLSLGIIGEYVSKIYLETKERPRFIVEATTGNSFLMNTKSGCMPAMTQEIAALS